MKTKVCSKCNKKLNINCFSKGNDKDGLQYKCKKCNKQYYTNNKKKISNQARQYYNNNKLAILKHSKQYRKNNKQKIIKKNKIYYQNNTTQLAKKQKQYRKNNIKKIAKYQEHYYKNNHTRLIEHSRTYRKNNISKILQYDKTNALFKSYYKELEIFEKTRRCSENRELLEVKCAYCGKWLKPTNQQVRNRLQAFKGAVSGERRFYCSENCKRSCPIYGQRKYPKNFKKATSREVVPLLRQLVLERDNYTCQKCEATTETAQLHVHHEKSYTLNKIMANDPDNCITLCKECHKEAHSNDGCKYSDLKC